MSLIDEMDWNVEEKLFMCFEKFFGYMYVVFGVNCFFCFIENFGGWWISKLIFLW